MLLLATRGMAADGNPARAAYFKYCSACHGLDGRGHGPVANSLQPPPSDLTQLARRNGGTFPVERVRTRIDGRQQLAAHGPAAMPVWGTVFRDEPSWTTPAAHSDAQIRLITDYLRALQGP
ncbi:MAG: c-type cytochrome [bacterium]